MNSCANQNSAHPSNPLCCVRHFGGTKSSAQNHSWHALVISSDTLRHYKYFLLLLDDMATLMHSQQPAAQAQQIGSSHPFTCNTCQVAFRGNDLQRTHMQSDWHRYNLKRRVASLPPLTSEVFAEKVLANKASAAATAARASFEKRCEACDKTYFSEGAYTNHLGSQKHKTLLLKLARRAGADNVTETESMTGSTFSLGDPIDTASSRHDEDDEAEEEFEEVVERMKKAEINTVSEPVSQRPGAPTPGSASHETEHRLSDAKDAKMEDGEEQYEHKADVKQCLFCNYSSPTLDLNMNHMSRQHGFFVPERDYLVDLSGLLNHLSETIMVLCQCVYCQKNMHTSSGVQTHMRDRGHCMIAYGTEDEQLEVGEFYDFRATYSDEETDEEEADVADRGVKLGVKRGVKKFVQNGAGEDEGMLSDDEAWESESDVSSVPTDEITSVPIDRDHMHAKLDQHRHHSRADPRPHKHSDGYHSHAHQTPTAVYHDDYELHLPSGRTAGHRSLRTYFRQNLRNYPSAEERAEQRMLEEGGRRDSDDDSEERETNTRGNESSRGRQIVSRANGGLGMLGVSDAKKREIRAVEKRQAKHAQRAGARYEWFKNKKANHQKHFRDHLLQ